MSGSGVGPGSAGAPGALEAPWTAAPGAELSPAAFKLEPTIGGSGRSSSNVTAINNPGAGPEGLWGPDRPGRQLPVGCGGLPRPSRGAGLSSTSGGLLGGSVLSEDRERCPAGLEPAARAGTCFSWAFWCPCVKWGPSEPVGSGAFPGDPVAASRAGLDCPWEWTAGALAGRESRAGASVVWGVPAGSTGGFLASAAAASGPIPAQASESPVFPCTTSAPTPSVSERKAAQLCLGSGWGQGVPL